MAKKGTPNQKIVLGYRARMRAYRQRLTAKKKEESNG